MSRLTPKHRIPDMIKAAVEVFSRKGYRLAQMEEIAKGANISKATLYYYFKNKAHLFYYILENGVPEESEMLLTNEVASPTTESALLALLKKRLQREARFANIVSMLNRKASDIDIEKELSEILESLWDLFEKNSMQILILEKSAFEFPELAAVYDAYARKQVLRQLEEFLSNRMGIGLIRQMASVSGVARFILETLAWFGFKQFREPNTQKYTKSETLSDLVSIIVNGLKA